MVAKTKQDVRAADGIEPQGLIADEAEELLGGGGAGGVRYCWAGRRVSPAARPSIGARNCSADGRAALP
jgi:hypothetical protein